MFPKSKYFKCNYVLEEEGETEKTPLLVKIHGRSPIQSTGKNLMGYLLSLLKESSFSTFDSGRRMADLVFPYEVLVRGPGKRCPYLEGLPLLILF